MFKLFYHRVLYNDTAVFLILTYFAYTFSAVLAILLSLLYFTLPFNHSPNKHYPLKQMSYTITV
jgi:hypothetical protein